jgi:hypothetical protein
MAEQTKASSNQNSAPPAPDLRHHSDIEAEKSPSGYTAQLQQALGVGWASRNTSGVTIRPAPHLANALSLPSEEAQSAESILKSKTSTGG